MLLRIEKNGALGVYKNRRSYLFIHPERNRQAYSENNEWIDMNDEGRYYVNEHAKDRMYPEKYIVMTTPEPERTTRKIISIRRHSTTHKPTIPLTIVSSTTNQSATTTDQSICVDLDPSLIISQKNVWNCQNNVSLEINRH